MSCLGIFFFIVSPKKEGLESPSVQPNYRFR